MPKSDNQKLKILYILDYLQKNSNDETPVRTGELIAMLEKTEKNKDFFKRLKEWLAIWEKEGYTIRSLRSSV